MAKNLNTRNRSRKGPQRSSASPRPFTNPEAGELELLPPTKPAHVVDRWLPIAIIAMLALLVFIPSVDNGFVSWDDDHYVFDNHQVHYNDGIRSIWFDVFTHSDPKFYRSHEKRVSHQYYPMLFTSYWLEFRFHVWFNGADPNKTIQQNIKDGKMTASSFHVVSMVLHALNVMLLIFCFRALGFSNWVAWAATILFAVHPLQVATVAWATERKNIFALMFYLLSMMSYIKMRRQGGWWRFVLALVLFQAALFSKTVSLTLPVMLFFTDRLLERRWVPDLVLKSMLRLLPFVALSCIAAWTTIQVEDRQRTIPLTEEQRPFIPCASLLFYPAKMLLPINQSPVSPLWKPDPADFTWYLPILTVAFLGAIMLWYRKKLGSHFFWALFFYGVTQGPMLGFKNINYFQFAFVAEHYFYNGAVGLFLILALGIDWMRRHLKPPQFGFAIATGLICLATVAYGAKTWFYCNVWQDAESFWSRTLEMNPECWPAWYNTANARRREARDIMKTVEADRKEAQKLIEAANEHRREAEVLRSRSSGSNETETYNKIVDLLEKADALVEEANVRQAEADAAWEQANALLDEAVRRYIRVSEIHILISQPFDQWVATRQMQKDWAGALEGAEAAIQRFPHILKYREMAGSFAKVAKQPDKSVKYFAAAAKILAQSGDRNMGKRNPCAAEVKYRKVLKYYKLAAQQKPQSQKLQDAVIKARGKLQQANASCNASGK